MGVIASLLTALLFQQGPLASIEGVVVQLGTSQPVARAVVEASLEGREPYRIVTGADGRFDFRNVPPGWYQLKVSRTGYMNSVYGQRGPNGKGRALVVVAGQSMKDIRVAMVPYAAISGRVSDSSGEPLANVTVEALKYAYIDGQRTLNAVKSDITDDRGEYRLFWLPPGEYYVTARAPGSAADESLHVMFGGRVLRASRDGRIEDGGELKRQDERYVPVYYPGVTDGQGAAAIELRPGQDFGGADFTLAQVKPRNVRGTAVSSATGLPPTSATVALVPRGPSISESMPARPGDRDGFEIQGVLPGSYFLVATARIPAGENSFRIVGGRTPLEVSNTDLDGVTVLMAPAVDIAGQITYEGLANPSDQSHPFIVLKNELGFPRQAQSYPQHGTGGKFLFADIVEGDYRVQLSEMPNGVYVKSIRFGATDALNGIVHIDPGSTDRLEIVLGTNPGSLEGAVLDKEMKPVPNAVVTVVPDASRRQRSDLFKTVTADGSGRFQVRDIAPGDYFVFAWEDVEPGLWLDPEFIRRHGASGKRIQIGENSRDKIELTAIPFAF